LAISTTLLSERIRRPAVALRPGVVVVATTVLVVGGFLLSRSSFAHARGVEVSGIDHLSRSDVVDLAAVSKATNVVWLDEAGIERRLETHAWVADAEIDVALPATIRIEIVERVPVAVVSDGLGRTLVAADGTPLGPASRVRDLPKIDLPMAPGVDGRAWPSALTEVPHGARPSARGAAAALGAMSPALRADVVSVRVLLDGSMTLRLASGTHVRYGEPAAPVAKAQTLQRILAWGRATGERIANVNVVSPRTPAVRLGS
jgi:cell division protein FtsQ